MRARTLFLTLFLACLLPIGSAQAASSKFTIRGAGFGHGVGMSQYGAYGFAKNGSGYRDILAHYYTGTAIGNLDPAKRVRVLLQSTGTASFSGATRAGRRRLSARKTYIVRRRGASVQLLSPRRKRLGTYSVLRVTRSRGAVRLHGRAANGRVSGTYRGALDFRAGTFSGVDAVNSLPLDSYLRGVVPDESPPSWPIEALKAQAVAARTYAVATMKPTATFDLYPDTRSQVYGGVAAEVASTNAAVAATRGEVVTYNGQPVVTFFFSTSGGRTEDVENTPLGNEPQPWLKSVDDPYDDASPRHRWGPIRMSLKQADAKLGSSVKGAFRGIEVVRRGRSPRIVEADVIGTRGRTRVTGGQLRARFGLFDSWAFFTSITTGDEPPPEPTPERGEAGDEAPAEAVLAPTGGTDPFGSAAMLGSSRAIGVVAGRVLPVLPGARVTLQRRGGGRWVTVGSTRLRRGGRYSAPVTSPGLYRVRYHDETGSAVRIR
jgi:SpoIID/LytB domain protein